MILLLTENQVRKIVEGFMPRVTEASLNAMVDVLVNDSTQTGAARVHGVTHQSLSKNLIRFKEIVRKIHAY